MKALQGKTALVTGGAKRIGRAIAVALAREGADVAITFRGSAREARQTIAEMTALGVRAFALPCDVREETSIKAMMRDARRELGRLDILVNNAAIYETVAFEKLTAAQWENIFATNTRGPFLVSKHAAAELRKRQGRIIHLGSLGGIRPWETHAHYCASKAALHSLTQAMAKAYAPEIAVNCVAPGMIEAPEDRGTAYAKRFAAKTPMKRNGSAEDVAEIVRLLAVAPKFMTGQIVVVDGGLGIAT
jgi:NAD(P)-dependent dehydrogenase (short-subunit alcohol dehydrogenase family)